jgi:tetratricopeptide (TPR) repeat protein
MTALNGRHQLALAALLFLATLLTFVGARHGAFLPYDDDVYVTAHPFVAQGWTWAGVHAAFTRSFAANWHPLTWLSHMLDVQFFGLEPSGHHLTSVVLHALNAALLSAFLARATGRLGASVFAAALFALHPLRVESVAWVAERKDVLSGTFFMLTLLAYGRHARAPSAGRLALAALAGVAGLLSKPTLVTLPGVLLLLDRWPLGRLGVPRRTQGGARRAVRVGRLLSEKLAFLLPATALAWVTLRVQAADRSVSSLEVLPLVARVANALASIGAYVGDLLWPRHLAAFYPHPALLDPGAPAFDTRAAIGLGVLVLLLALAWLAWRRSPWIAVGSLWFLGMLVPVIGLVQTGEQARADRYTYLPSIGLDIALAFGLDAVLRPRAARRLAVAAAGAALAGLALATRAQVETWRDGVTLFRHATEAVPRNHLAWTHLGVALAEAGQRKEARAAFQEALRIRPEHAEAESNLGQVALEEGDPARARRHLERALELEPGLAQAAANLGVALARLGRDEEALAAFRRTVELAPREASGWWNLGLELQHLGQRAEATAALRRAAELAPFDAEIANSLRAAQERP